MKKYAPQIAVAPISTHLRKIIAATATAAASENAYFGVLSAPIPQNQDIDMIDIITFGATGENQSIQDVDIWIGNTETGEILEQIVTNETLYTVYSPRAQAYVLRITHEKSYDFPVFIVLTQPS